MIKIKFFSLLRLELGISEVIVDADSGSLLEILQQANSKIEKDLLAEICDSDLQVKKEMIVLLNGRNIRYLNGTHSEVTDGDEISIFPLCGGG